MSAMVVAVMTAYALPPELFAASLFLRAIYSCGKGHLQTIPTTCFLVSVKAIG
jgi:hypothetical protein